MQIVGHEDAQTRAGWDIPRIPGRSAPFNLQWTSDPQRALAWLQEAPKNSPQDAVQREIVCANVETRGAGWRVTVHTTLHFTTLEEPKTETETDIYDVQTVTPQWAQKWLDDNRRAAQQAVTKANHLMQSPVAAVMERNTYRKTMTPHAFRMAHYFALLPISNA